MDASRHLRENRDEQAHERQARPALGYAPLELAVCVLLPAHHDMRCGLVHVSNTSSGGSSSNSRSSGPWERGVGGGAGARGRSKKEKVERPRQDKGGERDGRRGDEVAFRQVVQHR